MNMDPHADRDDLRAGRLDSWSKKRLLAYTETLLSELVKADEQDEQMHIRLVIARNDLVRREHQLADARAQLRRHQVAAIARLRGSLMM